MCVRESKRGVRDKGLRGNKSGVSIYGITVRVEEETQPMQSLPCAPISSVLLSRIIIDCSIPKGIERQEGREGSEERQEKGHRG